MPKQRYSSSTIALALLAAGEVPNFLAGMLPSLMTIQRFGAEDVDRAALRRGEVLGSLMAMGVAYAASVAAQDPLPFYLAAATLVALLLAYEHALRHPSPSAAPIDSQPNVRRRQP